MTDAVGIGSRLGPYEIVSRIGAGGMGEVWRARDTRLDRQVAIKVLPAALAQNEQFRARFEREAKSISQLNHPNICTLYDIGHESDTSYLVMELLEGESLADRLARGPLPLADVIRYGAQIAAALDRAHRAGITHRDLKPGNVVITKSGAKLLDFGLAKSATPTSAVSFDGATEHRPLTQEGTILGTFQYMAPEQLAGEEADTRSDIFALGALLYEMATGRRAFEGKTKTSLIAQIIGGEPRPIGAFQPLTPAAFEHIVTQCLKKDPDQRWQSASDVALELRWIVDGPEATVGRPKGYGRLAGSLAALTALFLVLSAIAGFLLLRKPAQRMVNSSIDPPEDATFAFDNGAAVLSPDGAMIVFSAAQAGGVPLLWVRALDGAEARPLKATQSASFPFWSPDSKSIAFFAEGKLKRIDIASGAPETIAEATIGRGGAWSTGNTILFTPSVGEGIFTVPATGGAVRPVTQLNVNRGETSHRFPTFLPDGHHFLAFVQGAAEGGNILLGSTESKETRLLMTADGGVVFTPPNLILSIRNRVLRAQKINLKTFVLEGEAVLIAEGVQVSSTYNFASVSASVNGILSFTTGASATLTTLTFYDANGKEAGTVGPPSDQLDPRIAPDGHAVLVSLNTSSVTSDIWAFDLRRNVASRLTFSPANEWGPVWSPDSKSILYSAFDRRPGDLFIKRIEGSGEGELLYADKRRKTASEWTRDGKYIIYHALTPGTAWDIEAYSIADHKVIPLVKSAAIEMFGRVSPDGKWLAYASLEGSRSEVYVQRFPPTRERWQVSGGGGTMPQWSGDGRQLFYVATDAKLMTATVHGDGDRFVADAPRALFATRIRALPGTSRSQYDVARDGRFLINVTMADARRQPGITVIQNWTVKLRPRP